MVRENDKNEPNVAENGGPRTPSRSVVRENSYFAYNPTLLVQSVKIIRRDSHAGGSSPSILNEKYYSGK